MSYMYVFVWLNSEVGSCQPLNFIILISQVEGSSVKPAPVSVEYLEIFGLFPPPPRSEIKQFIWCRHADYKDGGGWWGGLNMRVVRTAETSHLSPQSSVLIRNSCCHLMGFRNNGLHLVWPLSHWWMLVSCPTDGDAVNWLYPEGCNLRYFIFTKYKASPSFDLWQLIVIKEGEE